ncbi:DUF5959 family protein [Streptomyces collinus]
MRGSLKTWVLPDDLRHWQEALDALDAGQDIRGPEVFIERDPEEERAHVAIRDASSMPGSTRHTAAWAWPGRPGPLSTGPGRVLMDPQDPTWAFIPQ